MQRYEKYKDSGIEWIGEIPEHWELRNLQIIAAKERYSFTGGPFGSDLKANEYTQKGIRIIQLQNIGIGEFLDDYKIYTSEKKADDLYNCNIFPNEVIVAKMADPVARACLMPDYDERYLMASDGIRIKVSDEVANSKYAVYSINSPYFKAQAEINSEGTTRLRIGLNALKKLKIILPSVHEQIYIATFLDRKTIEIDQIIANKQKLIALYEEEKQAIINEAITKGLDPNVKMKDSGVEWLGEIPEHWKVKRFNHIFSFSRGLPITKENLKDEGIPCLNYGEIHSKFGFEVNPEEDYLKCVDETYIETSEKSLLKRGDFVFADTSEDILGSGNFTYLNSDMPTFAGYHTIIAVPKADLISRFVAYYFNSTNYRNQIRSCVTGTKVYSITQSILKYTNIAMPPIKEQKLIIDYIDNEFGRLSSIIEKFNKQIDLLKEYRTTLISEVVTGKIKVC